MADNDKATLRYDDFVSNVQPDPAKPEATIMLSGFVGHGAEGHARIYPDPTLGTWYDVPEGDVIHSAPIADSKLGGSYVWVRAAAEIKPGSAAPAATEAVQPQAAAAIQPTPTAVTHCIICPPHTQAIMCPTQPVPCDTMLTPTPATRCFICPPLTQNCTPPAVCTHAVLCPSQPVVCNTMPTPATHCFICPPLQTQLVWCPTQPVICNLQHTQPLVCGIVPPTQGCQQGAAQPQPEAVMAAVPPNTAATVCTMPPGCMQQPTPATHCFICPPPQTPQCTLPTVCTMPPACPPPPTPATQCIVCPPNQIPHSLPTMCPMPPACPFGPLGGPTFIPTLLGCPPTLQLGCPPQTNQLPCPTQPIACNLQLTPTGILTPCPICPPATTLCPQGGAQQHQEAVAAAPAHPNTAATVCTMPPACPATAHTVCCLLTQPPICPPPGGGFTLATQCICLTPVNTMACFTLGGCPTLQLCFTPACPPTLLTCPPNGIFTPFGR